MAQLHIKEIYAIQYKYKYKAIFRYTSSKKITTILWVGCTHCVALHFTFKRENCRWWRQMLKLERSIRRQLRHGNPTHTSAANTKLIQYKHMLRMLW